MASPNTSCVSAATFVLRSTHQGSRSSGYSHSLPPEIAGTAVHPCKHANGVRLGQLFRVEHSSTDSRSCGSPSKHGRCQLTNPSVPNALTHWLERAGGSGLLVSPVIADKMVLWSAAGAWFLPRRPPNWLSRRWPGTARHCNARTDDLVAAWPSRNILDPHRSKQGFSWKKGGFTQPIRNKGAQ
jgi:hypothetical protein